MGRSLGYMVVPFLGGVTHLGHLVGHLAQKFHFFDTFVAAERVLGIH